VRIRGGAQRGHAGGRGGGERGRGWRTGERGIEEEEKKEIGRGRGREWLEE